MIDLYLWDDAVARRFEPFAHTRPIAELRAGAWLLRERWERAAGTRAAGLLTAPHLAGFAEPGSPRVHDGPVPAGAVVANTRCAPAATASLHDDGAVTTWTVAGRPAAIRLTSPCPVEELPARFAEAPADGPGTAMVAGRWIDAVWELVSLLPDLLTDDLLTISVENAETFVRPTTATIVGDHPVLAAPDATVEPFVVIDARSGPVILLEGSSVAPFSHLVGPLIVGAHSSVLGGSVRACSIGEWCKVHGEVASTVVLGYSNKSHDGFVGHSYVGRWVNIGAGTITSNLKNTYGTVSLWTPDGMRDTGLQFLGTFFGDHAKTGIGITLTTGCVLGAGVNVFGAMPPKVVPPFSWGDHAPYTLFELEKFVAVCRRQMARRQVVLDGDGCRFLAAVHAARWGSSA